MTASVNKGWRIWPTSVHWGDLESPVRRHALIALVFYLAVVSVGFLKSGPTRKDMMMFEFARAHVEKGLSQTHGYNLSTKWSTSPTDVAYGKHNVYVSAPPLYPFFCAGMYALGGENWRALRMAPILLGLIWLYSCLALAAKFLQGAARGWMLYFALSPMILIYATDLEINTGHLGLVVLAYLCFVNFLETAQRRWMIWAAAIYLLAFWNSFIAASMIPAAFVQLLLHPGLTRAQRREGLLIGLGAVALGISLVLLHLAGLPGAWEWMTYRLSDRISTTATTGASLPITLKSFSVRQGIRLLTHYTPVCVALAGIALALCLRRRPTEKTDGPAAVTPAAALVQFFTWGIPTGFLAIDLAYIHPFYLYYCAAFFTFGSALALAWLAGKRRWLANACIVIFLFLTISRSVFAATGGSLAGLFRDHLPESVTRHWKIEDKPRGNIVVIPPEQW